MALQTATIPIQQPTIKNDSFFVKHTKLVVVSVVAACMIGVALIFQFVLANQSIRLDEAQSLWQTSHSPGEMLRVVAEDVHVPLYHVILHFWQLYFGNGIQAARLLSLLFLLVTIPLAYLLARQILIRGWALFATVIFSFMPFMDWYGSEARMYTLLVMMATLSQYFYIKILRSGKGWGGYAVSALVGAYSHYFFSFNLAAQAIYFLFNRRRFPRGSFKRFIVVALLVGAALAPWIWYFHSLGSGQNTTPHLARPTTVDFFNVFSQFLFGFQNNHINTILVSCWPLTVLIAFLAVNRGQKVNLAVGYIATAAFLPVIIAFLLSFVVNPFFLSRYMISCVAPLVILTVWLISNYGRRLSLVASIILVLAVVLGSAQQYASSTTPVKEDYKQVAQQLGRQAKAQDLVVISAPFTIYPFEYYYNGQAQIVTLPIWDRHAIGGLPAFSPKELPNQVKQLNKNHRNIYLLLSQDQGYEENIRQYYLQHFKQISHKTYSPGLDLYVFKVGFYNAPALGTPNTLIKAP
jgi:mannosyltransferase